MNKVKVRIYNREYSLQTEETPEYTRSLARKLDEQISEMLSDKKAPSVVDAALLVALSALDESQKVNDNIDNLRTQIKDYVDDASDARMKAEELARQNKILKEKNYVLEQKLGLVGLEK